MLGRSALRADSTAMLGPGSRRKTPFVRFAHCGQTVSASQFTKRAARADPGPALLATANKRFALITLRRNFVVVAPEIAPAGHRLPLNRHRGGPATNTAMPERQFLVLPRGS